MMSAPLRVVTASQRMTAEASATGNLSDRVRRLQAEAKLLASEHVDALKASLLHTQQIADEIAQGGEAYPAGVRDIARRLAEDHAGKMLTIQGIMARI